MSSGNSERALRAQAAMCGQRRDCDDALTSRVAEPDERRMLPPRATRSGAHVGGGIDSRCVRAIIQRAIVACHASLNIDS